MVKIWLKMMPRILHMKLQKKMKMALKTVVILSLIRRPAQRHPGQRHRPLPRRRMATRRPPMNPLWL